MDTKALERIEENTEIMVQLADLPDKLRRIADFMDANPKSQSDIRAIAKFLETDARDLLNPLYLGAIAVFDLLCSGQYLSYEEIAIKTGRSRVTAQQTISALIRGGLDLEESPARGYRARTGRPRIGKKIKR
jgi:biotin operon repressor